MKELYPDTFLTLGPSALFGLLTDGLCVTRIELPNTNITARSEKGVSGPGRIAR